MNDNVTTVKHALIKEVPASDAELYPNRIHNDGRVFIILDFYDTYREAKDHQRPREMIQRMETGWRYK